MKLLKFLFTDKNYINEYLGQLMNLIKGRLQQVEKLTTNVKLLKFYTKIWQPAIFWRNFVMSRQIS